MENFVIGTTMQIGDILTIVQITASIVIYVVTKWKEKYLCYSECWNKKIIIDNNLFYVKLLFGTMVADILLVLICNMVKYKILGIVIAIVGVVIQILFINTLKSIKKRKISCKFVFWFLIDSPSIIYMIAFLPMTMFEVKSTGLEATAMGVLLISEMLALLIFEGRYKRYAFSQVDIYQKSGKMMLNIDIETISKRGKWIVIKTGGE